jgi:acid phosphatase family membrane protein YuiD
MSWLLCQLLKLPIDRFRHKKVTIISFLQSGGFPSSHSAFVTALSVSIGLTDGVASSQFAIAAVFAFVVMQDAIGLRRNAGRTAEAVNELIAELEARGIVIDRQLKEALGHTPIEIIAGIGAGIGVSALLYNLCPIV